MLCTLLSNVTEKCGDDDSLFIPVKSTLLIHQTSVVYNLKRLCVRKCMYAGRTPIIILNLSTCDRF